MRFHSLVALVSLFGLVACATPQFTGQVAYAQLSLDGDLGYATAGSSAPAVKQDIESAFGLGDDQGTPYARLQLDVGVPVFAVSGFMFEDDGTGQLQADFGDVNAGLGVNSEFEMFNAKASMAFQIEIGPVSLSPGLAIDYCDLQMDVRDVFNTQQESVDVAGPVPLGFLRAEAKVWLLAFIAEAGYMEIDIDDADGKLLDVEAMIEVRPTGVLNVFVGYRHLNLQVDGEVDGDAFDADITLSGLLIGGGVRF